jgi:primosomal protein N' (replication factor Y)
MPRAPVVRVALATPLRQLFDYRTGEHDIQPGIRVRVPFGRQQRIGVVMATAEDSDVTAEKLKAVLEPLDEQPVFDAGLLQLLQWAAGYYHHPIGEVLTAAMPKALRLGADLAAQEERWRLTAEGRDACAAGEPRRAPRQQAVLAALRAGECSATQLRAQCGETWRSAARALAERGWIEAFATDCAPTPAAATPPPYLAGPPLNDEQSAAAERIQSSLGQFGAFVLQGITGSGKTEVYLRVTEAALARGTGALVLVPEIGLTPQLVGRFRERFGIPMAVLHSGLTDHERLIAWREAYSGRARVVLGTRSAVFAPLAHLGVIIADEEHDASYKQQEGGFRYSARDLAVMRARGAAVPVVLGSATPAVETLHNVAQGRYTRLTLTRRAVQTVGPRLALIDLRAHAHTAGLSTPAVQAIERHLGAGGQILVFINRRGYAPTLLCTACGWVAPCKDCDARLTVHLHSRVLRCHHCGAEEPLPERCPQCGFAVKPVGQGTERIEETLAQLFPGVPCVRFDRDVVRRRGDLEAAVQRITSGEGRILVGTQMVTKGHDFPNLTLVVVLNADQGLFSTDFRAPERLAQTIVQVAGRAGRGTRPGEVLIQTEFPDHPLLTGLLAEGYEGFARTALTERREAAWPPFSRLAAVRDSAHTAEAALQFLTEARTLAEQAHGVRLLGPVPAAMARRAGRHHAQLLIESADRGALHRFLETWLVQLAALPSARRVRWALDVDPMELF